VEGCGTMAINSLKTTLKNGFLSIQPCWQNNLYGFVLKAFPTFAPDASSRLGKYATVFAMGGYGSTRSTETPALAYTAQLLCLDS